MVSVPDKILKELKKIKDAEGFLLTGSRALGKASRNSDWDIFVLLKDKMPDWRKTFKIDNTWLELLCNNKEEIGKYFKEDAESGRGVNIRMFIIGQIIEDNASGAIRSLCEQAQRLYKKGPKKLSKVDRQWIDYDFTTYLQDIEDCLNDKNSDYLLINYAIHNFINYYYRLRGIWPPRPKDRLADFLRREKFLGGLIYKINQSSDWRKKARLAISLGKKIGARLNLRLDGCVHLPPVNPKG